MASWRMKSEPTVYSIADPAKDRVTSQEWVRIFLARNFMCDEMQVGNRVLFHHSNANPAGVAGVAK